MSSTPTPDRRTGVPASISAQLTVFFDGRFWVGVLEHHELRHGGDAISCATTVRAARHVFGAEPSDVELYDFLLTHGGALIDRAAASPPIPTSGSAGSAGSLSAPHPNPKRAARRAAKEAARARPSTAAQAALSAAREETSARAAHDRSRRRRQEADEAWARHRQRAKRRHRGR